MHVDSGEMAKNKYFESETDAWTDIEKQKEEEEQWSDASEECGSSSTSTYFTRALRSRICMLKADQKTVQHIKVLANSIRLSFFSRNTCQ